MSAFIYIDVFFLFLTLLPTGLTQEACQNPRNQAGTCVSIRNCEELLDILRKQRDNPEAVAFLQQSQCGYDNGPLVCCPGKSEAAPKIQLPVPPNCGYSNVTHTKVVGGVDADRGAWPWMAALGYRPKSTSTSQKPLFLCGGSLITTKHVLTAAHCVHNSPSLYMVRVGDLDIASDTDDQYAVNILIAEKIVYEKYDKSTHLGDIAILKLQEDIPQSPYIQPICMPSSPDLRSKNLVRYTPFLAGWGSTSYKGPASSKLQEIQIPVVDQNKCKEVYAPFRTNVIDQTVLCAGFTRGGKDACQGDSGGPLMLPQGLTYYQIGVVSYGYRCAEPGFPGIYTRVTEYLEWISKNAK